MLCRQVAIAALVAGVSSAAYAYDTGKLTCHNVGQLAAQMLIARQSGVPPQTYLAALNQKLPPEAQVERRLALDIAKVVYTSEEIGTLQPEQAYAIFAQNCMEGQEQDRMSGQRDDSGSATDENEQEDNEDSESKQ